MDEVQQGVTPEFLRREQAAAFVGMSQAFLMKMEKLGKGPRVSRLGRAPVYSIADLRAWVESRRENT